MPLRQVLPTLLPIVLLFAIFLLMWLARIRGSAHPGRQSDAWQNSPPAGHRAVGSEGPSSPAPLPTSIGWAAMFLLVVVFASVGQFPMNGLHFFLLIVGGLLAAAFLLSGFQLLQVGYNSVREQSVVRIADDYLRKQQLLDEPRRWAETHGFRWEGGFRLRQEGSTTPPVCVAIWADADRTRWFLVNLTVEGRQLELITDFSDGSELDTATSCYAHFFPQPPRAYVQSFDGLSADELWSRHRQGEAYLTAECGVARQPRAGGAEQRLREAVRTRLDYARSHRFYGVRALYRYFVGMRRLHDRPVQELAPPTALASMKNTMPA